MSKKGYLIGAIAIIVFLIFILFSSNGHKQPVEPETKIETADTSIEP